MKPKNLPPDDRLIMLVIAWFACLVIAAAVIYLINKVVG